MNKEGVTACTLHLYFKKLALIKTFKSSTRKFDN